MKQLLFVPQKLNPDAHGEQINDLYTMFKCNKDQNIFQTRAQIVNSNIPLRK